MPSSSQGFLNYTVEPEGRCVKTVTWKLLSVVGCGQLDIVAKQPGGPVTICLGKVIHVPKLERNVADVRTAGREKPHVAYL